jgi:hypothetical protein
MSLFSDRRRGLMQSSTHAWFSFLRRSPRLIPGLTPRFFLAMCVALAGCRSGARTEKASIAITRTPSADPGGPVKMDYIQGTVSDAGSGDQVALYAYSGNIWWIQPFRNQPFTRIQPDSTWRNWTHLGVQYAALLVGPNYRPPSKLTALPGVGQGVDAVAVAKGAGSATIVPRVIHFSGFDWTVRAAASDRGGESNFYDPDNVWLDHNGYLHLRMQQRNNHWSCAEVSLNRSLGYGTYKFVVEDNSHLSPSASFGLYTLDELRSDEVRSELDVEISQWGISGSKNAQFVVQPFYVPENVSRFEAPPGVLTYSWRWEAGKASFKAVRGAGSSSGATVSEHLFTSGVPAAASETVRMDLYDYRHSRQKSEEPAEVVIEKFEFLP